ncbi:MAG: clan AA aspartic protease [Bacteroidaceae bacterium]|nr:clan AA aspartic protease [Bacteroidaceae bacterium]
MRLFFRTLSVSLLLLLASALPVRAFYMSAPYVMEGGKMYVRATVGGQTGKFLLDTGAPCSLTADFARRAGVSGGQTQRFWDSNGQPVTVRVAMLDRLVLGGFSFMQLQAMVLPEGNPLEMFGVDGIIGVNLMAQGVTKFDGSRRLFILTDERDSLSLDYNYCTEMLLDGGAPMLPVRVGTQVDTVMFDSGADALYEMSASTYRRLAADTASVRLLAQGVGTLSAGAAGVEEMSQKWRLLLPKFYVGAAPFARVTTITTDAPDSRIGSALLGYGDVVLDFEEGFFYFLPRDAASVPDAYTPEWNAVLTVLDGRIVAGMVWDARPDGIQSGDPIVAIGSRRLTEADARAALTTGLPGLDPSGTAVTYLDRRTGQERAAVLRME